MNWYKLFKKAFIQKTAGITFFLDGSQKISQPHTLMRLSSELMNFANNKVPGIFKSIHSVSTDTSHYDDNACTGVINVYPESTDQQILEKVIQDWIEDKNIMGFQISVSKNMSNMFKKLVYRVNIEVNPTEEYTKIPELDMNEDNALAIMRTLGLFNQYYGSMSLEEMKNRINQVSQEKMDEAVEENFVQDDPGQAKVINFGRDKEYVDNRLQGLYEVVDFGLKNGFKNIVWG